MENQVQRALRPIYQAIDLHQYSKALKLTLIKPQNTWPIIIALRCHCLERCGPVRYREACIELRALLGVLGNDWAELDEKIWLLSLDSNASDANSSAGNGNATANANANANANAGKSNASGAGGKKTKGKKNSKAATTAAATKSATASASASTNSNNNQLDAVDVLDLSTHQRQIMIQAQTNGNVTNANASKIQAFEITDEHTIATLVISLNALRLPRTTAKLYSCAIEHIQKMLKTKSTFDLIEQLCTLLIQGYLSQLKLIATIPSFSPSSLQERLENARATLKGWEDAQFLAMTLVKHSGEALYQSWLILAVVEHYQSCKSLMEILKENKDKIGQSSEEEVGKLTQKLGMLPRLAEMMTTKQIKAFTEVGQGPTKFSPSADDVRLFVECLEIQSNNEVALDFLTQLGFSHLEEGESTKMMGRKINDEDDVNHHLGSLIQMTEKEAFEIKVRLLSQLNRNDEVFEIYSKKLLRLMPDQWSYWQELLKCSALCTDQDKCLEACAEVLERVLGEEEKKKLEGEGPKVPLRGPHLFAVEMAAHSLDNATSSTQSALTDLSKEIVNYGTIFAPIVFCCFQDIRKYLGPLVQKSTKNGILSDDVQNVLAWALKLRNDNDPAKADDTEETLTDKQERKSKLRAYIASVKICFEIWFQLNHQCEGDLTLIEGVNVTMTSFIPTSDEMIAHWNNTMDLGSNPKDGGQKEYLPGDDLVLLTIQLLLHKERSAKPTLLATVLAENAIHHSPYNPYLKIVAIHLHIHHGSAKRAWEIFQDMVIKQIQLDSCSYFILRHLVNNGLYKEAIEQAGKILSLHSSSEKDLCSFMAKAMDNGNLHKGREMIHWQREKMATSLQLLEAKGLIMDLATLLNIGDSDPKIGPVHGLCGGDHDTERVEKIIRDSTNSNAAPSLLNLAGEKENNGKDWSDNRDFDTNQFEILQKITYPLPSEESFVRAHMHAVLTRLVLLRESTKQPKKGKIVKLKEGETLDKRSKSLWLAVENADSFLSSQHCQMSKMHSILWKLTQYLSKATCIVASGRSNGDSSIDSTDSLTQREEKCIAVLESALAEFSQLSASSDFSVYRIVPDILITTFATFRITAITCNTFGWSKRKRDTKPVAGSLAKIAQGLYDFVNEMMINFEANPVGTEHLKDELDSIQSSLMVSNGRQMADKIIEDIALNDEDSRNRLLPILKQMVDEFGSFNSID